MKIEPWDLKTDSSREANTLHTFIIFCEDEVCEPTYFKFFETSKIKINYVAGQNGKMANVITAIHHCKLNDFMEIIDGEMKLLDDDVHVWCVFDRDAETDQEKLPKGNVDFNESISLAKRRGFKVAWSNDCFELWVLLHFMDVDPKDIQFKERENYYNLLTEIFKEHPTPNESLQKAKRHPSFHYKRDLKSLNNFREVVRPEMINNLKLAINRAKVLESATKKDSNEYHEWVPYTEIHYLVDELIRYGGKLSIE